MTKILNPSLVEVKFPRKNLITLDITKFNTKSATCCFTAVQNAMNVIEYDDYDGELGGRVIERVEYECPTCGARHLPYGVEFCPNKKCGQKLRW